MLPGKFGVAGHFGHDLPLVVDGGDLIADLLFELRRARDSQFT
jgi:hypothetical protein